MKDQKVYNAILDIQADGYTPSDILKELIVLIGDLHDISDKSLEINEVMNELINTHRRLIKIESDL